MQAFQSEPFSKPSARIKPRNQLVRSADVEDVLSCAETLAKPKLAPLAGSSSTSSLPQGSLRPHSSLNRRPSATATADRPASGYELERQTPRSDVENVEETGTPLLLQLAEVKKRLRKSEEAFARLQHDFTTAVSEANLKEEAWSRRLEELKSEKAALTSAFAPAPAPAPVASSPASSPARASAPAPDPVSEMAAELKTLNVALRGELLLKDRQLAALREQLVDAKTAAAGPSAAFCSEALVLSTPRLAAGAAPERPSSSWLSRRASVQPSLQVAAAAAASGGGSDSKDGDFEDAIREEMEAMRTAYERKIKHMTELLDGAGIKHAGK